MANPNNTGIRVPRQSIGSLNAPGVNPQYPAQVQPFDMAGAVNKMLGYASGIAGQFADRNAQQDAVDEQQANKDFAAREMERHANNDLLEQTVAAQLIDAEPKIKTTDFSAYTPQFGQTVEQAVDEGMKLDDRWAGYQPEVLKRIRNDLVDKVVASEHQKAKIAIEQGTQAQEVGYTQMLMDAKTPADFAKIADITPAHIRTMQNAGRTKDEIAVPIVSALHAKAANGDVEGVDQLSKMAESLGLGLGDHEVVAKNQANEQVKQNATAAQKEIADQQKAYIDNFGNYVAEMKLNSDTADMPQAERRKVADNLRVEIGKSQLEPTKKETMVEGVNRWELNNGTVNWQSVNDLRMDTDRSAATQQPNPTLLARAEQIYNDGGFGKGKAGAQMYQDTVRRIQSTTFDVRLRFSEPAMSWFKTEFKPAESSLNSKMNYMVNQEVRKRIADNPNMSESDITRMAWSRATLYKNMVESQPTTLEDQLDFEGESRSLTPRVKTKAEADALPSGTKFYDPNGILRVKP